jgi:hypothetical protein
MEVGEDPSLLHCTDCGTTGRPAESQELPRSSLQLKHVTAVDDK